MAFAGVLVLSVLAARDFIHVLSNRIRRWGNLRRIVALAVALCVAVGPLEALIPDAHDGDAQPTFLNVVEAHPLVSVPPTNASELPTAREMDSSVPAAPEGRRSAPMHDVHVDHCSHSHLVAVAHASLPQSPRPVDRHHVQSAERWLASVTRAPNLRPPIA